MLGPEVPRRLELLRAAGVDAAAVEPGELADRMPALAAVDGPAAFDAEGGSIRAAAAVGALVGRLGDDLVTDEALALWERAEGSVEVRAAGARGEHGSAVVCAGRDTARFARGLGLSIPVEMSLHGRVSFDVRGPAPRASRACSTAASNSARRAYTVPRHRARVVTRSVSMDARPPARTRASSRPPRWPRSPIAASPTCGGRFRASIPLRSATATAGSRRCPGARTRSASGSRAGRCSSRATTCSSTPAVGRALAEAALDDALADELRPGCAPWGRGRALTA